MSCIAIFYYFHWLYPRTIHKRIEKNYFPHITHNEKGLPQKSIFVHLIQKHREFFIFPYPFMLCMYLDEKSQTIFNFYFLFCGLCATRKKYCFRLNRIRCGASSVYWENFATKKLFSPLSFSAFPTVASSLSLKIVTALVLLCHPQSTPSFCTFFVLLLIETQIKFCTCCDTRKTQFKIKSSHWWVFSFIELNRKSFIMVNKTRSNNNDQLCRDRYS